MKGLTFSEYVHQNLAEKDYQYSPHSQPSRNSDDANGIGQKLISDYRLQTYQIEQQARTIQALSEKVAALELHRATQVGQDKIIGFMVGAIVLSLLSLATSIFFKPVPMDISMMDAEPTYPEVVLPTTYNS